MSAERVTRAKLGVRRSAVAEASSANPSASVTSERRLNHLKDEVYREMLRLEAEQPGAEMGLALALLRAVVMRKPALPMRSSSNGLGPSAASA